MFFSFFFFWSLYVQCLFSLSLSLLCIVLHYIKSDPSSLLQAFHIILKMTLFIFPKFFF